MTASVQIILVLPEAPDAASNKRVKRPEPTQQIPQKNGQWPLSQQPPDAETRRHLDAVRRDIAHSRPEIERFLRGGPNL
jgi:hypothetical protein